jgi:hypothetical protein
MRGTGQNSVPFADGPENELGCRTQGCIFPPGNGTTSTRTTLTASNFYIYLARTHGRTRIRSLYPGWSFLSTSTDRPFLLF